MMDFIIFELSLICDNLVSTFVKWYIRNLGLGGD